MTEVSISPGVRTPFVKGGGACADFDALAPSVPMASPMAARAGLPFDGADGGCSSVALGETEPRRAFGAIRPTTEVNLATASIWEDVRRAKSWRVFGDAEGGIVRSWISATLAGGLVFVGFGLAASAQTLNDANAAYAKGDYATAVKDLRPLAEQGFALAQVDLGALYHDGQGVAKDDVQAASWYRKAADQGDADGQFRLGMSYYEGWGLTQDFAQAAALMQKSAGQGDASAMGMLAACYDAGQGVPQSYVTVTCG
jgi:hypothetical protein